MRVSTTAKKRSSRIVQVRDVSRWLALAATPTFAVMAWISAADASHAAMHASAPVALPLDGMGSMYLLMSVFHVPPWLKLAADRPRGLTQSAHHTEGD